MNYRRRFIDYLSEWIDAVLFVDRGRTFSFASCFRKLRNERMKTPGLMCLAILLGSTRMLQAGESPQNVLFITVDDMSYRTPAICGGPINGLTPNMDRLASEGVRFEQAFVTVSVCTPSRHVWLTGQHSHTTHTEGFVPLRRGTANLISELKKDGYFCAMMNKNPGGYPLDAFIDDRISYGRDPQRYYDQMKQWAGQDDNRPFFIQMNIMDPHRPFAGSPMESVLPGYSKMKDNFQHPGLELASLDSMPEAHLPDLAGCREDLRRYYLSVARADKSIGKILQALEESGEAKNTLVLFSSDHGMSMPFSKANAWEESLRVPLFVRWPGRVAAGRVNSRHYFSSVDLAPTILDCLGLKIPAEMQGRSAKAVLEAQTEQLADGVFGYFYRGTTPFRYPMFSWTTDEYHYVFNVWHRPVKDQLSNKVDGRYPGHSDMTIGAAWHDMLAAEVSDAGVRDLVDHHRFRCREELYRRGDPAHPVKNLAGRSEHQSAQLAMKTQMLTAMRSVQHPLADLIERADESELAAFMNTLRNEETASVHRYPGLEEDVATLQWKVGSQDHLRLLEVNDGKFAVENRDGVMIVLSPPMPLSRVGYLYFQVHDEFTRRIGPGDYVLDVSLRSREKVPLRIQYAGRETRMASTETQQINPSEAFERYRFILRDALFDNSLPKGGELRFVIPSAKQIELQSLEFGVVK